MLHIAPCSTFIVLRIRTFIVFHSLTYMNTLHICEAEQHYAIKLFSERYIIVNDPLLRSLYRLSVCL